MKATELRIGDERWGYGHPLYRITALTSDNIHVEATTYWYAFNCYDRTRWHVTQNVDGMRRPTSNGTLDPIIVDAEDSVIANDPDAAEIGSQIGRLLRWMSPTV